MDKTQIAFSTAEAMPMMRPWTLHCNSPVSIIPLRRKHPAIAASMQDTRTSVIFSENKIELKIITNIGAEQSRIVARDILKVVIETL